MTDDERIEALAQFTDDDLFAEWSRRLWIESERLLAELLAEPIEIAAANE